MRLAQFLTVHAEQILVAWDEFAATVAHEGKPLDPKGLRDHAAEILKTIAADLATPQTDAQRAAKSKGEGRHESGATAAEIHADLRIMAGFAIDAMITEYRALRASVVKLWTDTGYSDSDAANMQELTRFNEAIDQAIAESVGRYTNHVKKATDLFIGILGHDIRNPLGTICMSAEYLVRSGQLSAKAAEPIINSALRINSLIEQVVDYTRAQSSGVMPILRKPGNLADQMVKIVQESQVRHPTRQLRLESSGNFEGSWDEGRIGQLLSNLLGNAISYGSPNEPVTVKVWSTPKEVIFSVHNSGEPIAPQDLERIFQPLVRGSGSDGGAERIEPDGLGLGLYICNEIVGAHGGMLTVTSTANDGTTFTAAMPRFPPT